jgi:hypothetical protein
VLGLSNIAIEYKVHAESMKEGAEKMLAAKTAAASGEKSHRGRGAHHSAGTRHHNPGSISTSATSYSTGRGRGSHVNRESHMRSYFVGPGGGGESNMESDGGGIDRKSGRESQEDV